MDNRALLAKGKLTMPVLALGAEKSYGLTMADDLKQVALNVKGGVVPDSGHWIMEENPDATTRLVLDFLSANECCVPPACCCLAPLSAPQHQIQSDCRGTGSIGTAVMSPDGTIAVTVQAPDGSQAAVGLSRAMTRNHARILSHLGGLHAWASTNRFPPSAGS